VREQGRAQYGFLSFDCRAHGPSYLSLFLLVSTFL
jgi:hypothetical protein